MDSNDTILFIVLIVLLALSAFFSSAETALTTVNRIRIRNLADEGNKNAKIVLKITDDSSKMLTAILIGNNIVNLSAASLTTTLAYSLGGSLVAIANGILTVAILLFGEITPKQSWYCRLHYAADKQPGNHLLQQCSGGHRRGCLHIRYDYRIQCPSDGRDADLCYK